MVTLACRLARNPAIGGRWWPPTLIIVIVPSARMVPGGWSKRKRMGTSAHRACAKAISVNKQTAWLVFSPAFCVAAAGTVLDYAPAAAS